MTELKNKVAVITGGTKGIGLGIAHAMIAQGMKVVITGRDIGFTENTASDLGSQALGVAADVRSLESMEEVTKAAISKWGQIDVVIANAGVGHFGNIEQLTSEQWHSTIDTNLTGVFNTVKSSLSEVKKSKGYIITISSLAGTNFFAGGTAYNASKFGLTGFTQALMLDVRNDDVKVTTIMPGSVSSHFGGRSPEEGADWRIQPEDLGQMVVDLLHMHPRTLPSKVEVRPSKTAK